mmetsp:Transcript_26710/g.48994  ORF Transcript_26710/g.48994 Transcript_26710/m.48994 type:complete len:323 (-) Transcript_26710:78-1046(-)
MVQWWEIVGGRENNGIIVREGPAVSSSQATETRLSAGALVQELQLLGNRLHYRKASGTGPEEGWVSIIANHHVLARRLSRTPPRLRQPQHEADLHMQAGGSAPSAAGSASPPKRAATLNVRVRNMAGEELANLHLPKQVTAQQLQEEVREYWQAPADHQHFLCGEHILQDNDRLRTFATANNMLEVQLIRLSPLNKAGRQVSLRISGGIFPDQYFRPAGGTETNCTISVDMRSHLYDVKGAVEEALSISAREQRLVLEGQLPWDDSRETLGDLIRKLRRPPSTVYELQVLRFNPDKVKVFELMASGCLSAVQLDETWLIPAA